MKCKTVQELLLSDHLDGEIDLSGRAVIEKHLAACHECRQFDMSLKRAAVEPFKRAVPPEIPVNLWAKVRQTIETAPPENKIIELWEDICACAWMPIPAIALGLVMVLGLSLLLYPGLSSKTGGRHLAQNPAPALIDNDTLDLSYTAVEKLELGTSIEEGLM